MVTYRWGWALVLALSACAGPYDPRPEIDAVLRAQQKAWNEGDIESFMALGYVPNDSLVFTSGGTVRRGYNATLARYRKRYDSREKMGTLTFSDLEITPTGVTSAVVLGRWALDTATSTSTVGGVFSLVFIRTSKGWRILHDHTSVGP